MAYSSTLLNSSALDSACRGALSRSLSAEDLRRPENNIQMYLATGNSDGKKQLLVSDKIAAVSLKLKGPQRGFYTRNHSIFLGSNSNDDFEREAALVSANTMHLVLGLSELLFISVTTCSGKVSGVCPSVTRIRSVNWCSSLSASVVSVNSLWHTLTSGVWLLQEFTFSLEKALQPRVRDIKRRICETENSLSADDLQLVLAGVPLQDNIPVDALEDSGHGFPGSCHLHLVVKKSAKVRANACPQGKTMELSVCACEAASKIPSLPPVGEEEPSAWVASGPSMYIPWKFEEQESSSVLNHASFMRSSNCRKDAAAKVEAMLSDVRAGLNSGQSPKLTSDGSGGTYLMPSASGGSIAAVFKPMDEEPLALNCPRGMPTSESGEGLKRGTRVGEGAFREVAAYLLDHPENEEAAEGFAGVPPTTMVRCDYSVMPQAEVSPKSTLGGLDSMDVAKVGSLQQFVTAVSNCEDMGPSRFAAPEVHKIAVLDMRLVNADRNGANILVQKEGSDDYRLIPIDHGYCLPETVRHATTRCYPSLSICQIATFVYLI